MPHNTLLTVPEDLSGMPLEAMRALAFRLQEYIDGPAQFDERISYMPEYLRLVERINWRTS